MILKEIKIGNLTFHLYGAIIAVSILVGWSFAKKSAKYYKIPETLFDDPAILIPLVLAIVGARIYHVLDYWSTYQSNLISILYITNGGLGIWGAIAGAITGFYVVAKIRKMDFQILLDLAAPSLLLGQAIGRIGNFLNQEGFGPPTQKPWGIYIVPENRPAQFANQTYFHPTFFYEAALDFVFFLILIFLVKKLKRGQAFALYLIFYPTIRFITEFWRIDTWTVGFVKMAQVISIVVFAVGLYLFKEKGKK